MNEPKLGTLELPYKRLALYRGKPLESLTREELIEAIVRMDRVHRKDREQHAKDLDFLLG